MLAIGPLHEPTRVDAVSGDAGLHGVCLIIFMDPPYKNQIVQIKDSRQEIANGSARAAVGESEGTGAGLSSCKSSLEYPARVLDLLLGKT
jgi:hypothetical protein